MKKKQLPDIDEDVKLATKEDTDAIIDAVRELTKAVTDLSAWNKKWQNAGRM